MPPKRKVTTTSKAKPAPPLRSASTVSTLGIGNVSIDEDATTQKSSTITGTPTSQDDPNSNPADDDIEAPEPLDTTLTFSDFNPPTLNLPLLLDGDSYTASSPIPQEILSNPDAPVTLGIDEAGRGPVLGPMVYGVAYLLTSSHPLLTSLSYNDSKKLTPPFRLSLFRQVCTPSSPSFNTIGWSVRVMSARDISSGMLRPVGTGNYNLNTQAHDATIELIRGVLKQGVNVKEIFVDTVGPPSSYQAKLARLFPKCEVIVAKKADSLYPSVSAASVVAKVTRDVCMEKSLMEHWQREKVWLADKLESGESEEDQGAFVSLSGYPSDAKTMTWMRKNVDPVFGWGVDTRYSWSTAADMLKKDGKLVDWPDDEDEGNMNIMSFFGDNPAPGGNQLCGWFGKSVDVAEF